MRIISNFKDYYDFPTYGYNTDDRLVYERSFAPVDVKIDTRRITASYGANQYDTPWYNSYDIDEADFASYVPLSIQERANGRWHDRPLMRVAYLFICDKCYRLFIPSFADIFEIYTHDKEDIYRPLKVVTSATGFEETTKKVAKERWKPVDIAPTLLSNTPPVNTETGYPILLLYKGEVYKNPSLMYLGFSVLETNQIYQEIELFLGHDKDVISDNMDNTSKVVAKGFDKKVSFRKRVADE